MESFYSVECNFLLSLFWFLICPSCISWRPLHMGSFALLTCPHHSFFSFFSFFEIYFYLFQRERERAGGSSRGRWQETLKWTLSWVQSWTQHLISWTMRLQPEPKPRNGCLTNCTPRHTPAPHPIILLTPWLLATIKCSRLILYFFCPSPRISHFSF